MKTIYLRLCLIGLLLCSVLTNTAQTPEWINLHKGNSAFKAGDMSTAEKAYRQALKANPHSARAAFNLGDVYLNKKDAQNALKFYEQAAKQEKSKLVRAMAYHNMGYKRINKNRTRTKTTNRATKRKTNNKISSNLLKMNGKSRTNSPIPAYQRKMLNSCSIFHGRTNNKHAGK